MGSSQRRITSATIPRRRRHIPLRAHLPLEQGAEGVLIGDVEHPQGGDRHVDVDRVDFAPEQTLGLAPRDHGAEHVHDRAIDAAKGREALHVPALGLVLGHDQPHEVLVFDVVVVGELDDPADGVDRRQVLDFELVLRLADLHVDAFEDGAVEPLLAAEVVVDQPASGLRARRDRIHAGAVVAARRELGGRGRENPRAVGLRRLGLAHGDAASGRDLQHHRRLEIGEAVSRI